MNTRLSVYLLFATLFLAVVSSTARSQGFPWNDFKERKIANVVAITKKAFRSDDTMFLSTNPLSSYTEVTYTGQSRPISNATKSFLYFWTGTLNYGQDYAALYQTEYLYKDGDKQYWLPTQQAVTKYFAKELKPNDKMVIFFISAGARPQGPDIDCVLLVEEYQLPQNLDKVIKKPPPNN